MYNFDVGTNNSLVPSELHIVPILLDGEVISLFYIMQSENEWIVQLGKGLVSKIKAYANNSPFAIIYTSEGAYGYGHAVVICGVNQTVKSYAFMDPAVGEYCAGTIYTSSGKWSFISESSGNRFTMNGYGYYDG